MRQRLAIGFFLCFATLFIAWVSLAMNTEAGLSSRLESIPLCDGIELFEAVDQIEPAFFYYARTTVRPYTTVAFRLRGENTLETLESQSILTLVRVNATSDIKWPAELKNEHSAKLKDPLVKGEAMMITGSGITKGKYVQLTVDERSGWANLTVSR